MSAQLIGLWLSLIPTSGATSMIKLDLNQLVAASDNIIRGKVTEMWVEADPRSDTIWTHAQVEITSVLKGNLTEDVIILEQPGGQLGHLGTIVEGAARFSVGEEGYFFVERLKSERYVTVGMFQGKYNIRLEPQSREEIVVQYNLHPAKKFDHRFIPYPDETKMVFANSFEDSILESIENGWDGKAIPGTSLERLERINKKTNGGQ